MVFLASASSYTLSRVTFQCDSTGDESLLLRVSISDMVVHSHIHVVISNPANLTVSRDPTFVGIESNNVASSSKYPVICRLGRNCPQRCRTIGTYHLYI